MANIKRTGYHGAATPTVSPGVADPEPNLVNAAFASHVTYNGITLWFVTGAPDSHTGMDGDFAFRNDTPGIANQRIYVRISGTWTGIV